MRLSEQQFKELLDRYLNQTASADERELLDKFFDSYQSDLSEPNYLENNQELQHQILEEINTRIQTGEPARHSLIKIWLPIAASLSLFVFAYFFIGKNFDFLQRSNNKPVMIEEKTVRGQKLSIELPDGTNVQLNGGSKLSYPQTFNEKTREVNLTGEAFFEVVKDKKPFIVLANDIKTEVLGTSFNVKNIPGRNIEITLVEGSVNVISRTGKSSTLKPNQRAIVHFANAEVTTENVNTLRYISWKNNILYFEDTKLKEAIETLENWYGVKITLADRALDDCAITAKYQNESLNNVLGSLQFLLSLTIEHQDEGHITIHGKGCK